MDKTAVAAEAFYMIPKLKGKSNKISPFESNKREFFRKNFVEKEVQNEVDKLWNGG